MNVRTIAALIALAATLPLGCLGTDSSLQLTVSPGVAVPRIDQLKGRIEETLRQRSGVKMYTRQGDDWVEMKPERALHDLSATVRSYDEKERVAYVELTYPQYRMPVVQFWRFDGRRWSGTIDPGIFIR